MRHSTSPWATLCLVLALSGCGDDDGGTAPDAAVSGDSAVPGADAAPDAAPADTGDVEWLTEPEPLTIDHDIGLDFFYQYQFSVEAPTVYTLDLIRCSQIAGREETCMTEPIATTGSPMGGVRWGIDPSQYAVGENRWSFTLRLQRMGRVVDEDTIELVANVTACTECVMD